MNNYFTILGIAPRYALDEQALKLRYLELQMQLHPDRLSHLPDTERSAGQTRITLINEAYQTLKDEFKRAHYLIAQWGEAPISATSLAPSFLAEIFEIQEQLLEIKASTATQPHRHQEAEGILKETQHLLANDKKTLKNIFQQIDDGNFNQESTLNSLRMLLSRQKYYQNITDECLTINQQF